MNCIILSLNLASHFDRSHNPDIRQQGHSNGTSHLFAIKNRMNVQYLQHYHESISRFYNSFCLVEICNSINCYNLN